MKKGLAIKQIVYAIIALTILFFGFIAFKFSYSGVKKVLGFAEERQEIEKSTINRVLEDIASNIESCSNSAKDNCLCEFNIPKFPEGYSLTFYTGEHSLSFELYYKQKKVNTTVLNVSLKTECMLVCKYDKETESYKYEKVRAPKGITLILDKENVEAQIEGFSKPITFLNEKGISFKKSKDEFCFVLGVCSLTKGPSFLKIQTTPPVSPDLKEKLRSLPRC